MNQPRLLALRRSLFNKRFAILFLCHTNRINCYYESRGIGVKEFPTNDRQRKWEDRILRKEKEKLKKEKSHFVIILLFEKQL